MNTLSLHATLRAFFDDIASAFGAGDMPRFRQLYALPCVVLTAEGALPLLDDGAFTDFFAALLARLRTLDFARSAFRDLTVTQLTPSIALAAMHWTRYRGDDSVIETLGATYTLVLQDGRWRIMALIPHGADAIPTLL